MDIYDTLTYMSLMQQDEDEDLKPDLPFDTETQPIHNQFHTDDMVIVDEDDVKIPQKSQKSQKKMKRIHIPDATIKPFHNRYKQNNEQNNEPNNPITTITSTQKYKNTKRKSKKYQ